MELARCEEDIEQIQVAIEHLKKVRTLPYDYKYGTSRSTKLAHVRSVQIRGEYILFNSTRAILL